MTDPSPATPAVEIRDLTYRFGDHTAVDHLDLDVAPGECFGLLGPNGAGKTTTIRVITTLLPVPAGHVRVAGHDVRTDKTAVRRHIGYVPQQLSVESALTARENVAWFARLFDVPRRERRERVDEVLDLVDLLDDADRVTSTFSGGMIRRLELAQALVNRPEILVLDEPTVGLDPVARESIWERLQDMRARHGMTILLTTHYMEEAAVLCDRVALMGHGRLAECGPPGELASRLGPQATLEDLFRHHFGHALDQEGGGLRDVRSTRRTARRVG